MIHPRYIYQNSTQELLSFYTQMKLIGAKTIRIFAIIYLFCYTKWVYEYLGSTINGLTTLLNGNM